jgi:hypothetical protein
METKFKKAKNITNKLKSSSIFTKKYWQVNKKLNGLIDEIEEDVKNGKGIETFTHTMLDGDFGNLLSGVNRQYYNEFRKESELTWRLIYLKNDIPKWKFMIRDKISNLIDKRRTYYHKQVKNYD